MLIAVDIGNSNVVLGIFKNDQWEHFWRFPTISDHNAGFYYDLEIRTRLLEKRIDISELKGIILSTVVPDLKEMFKSLLNSIFQMEVVLIGPELYKLLNFKVPRPYEIGSDLVANSYAAYKLYSADCIVVDFGTALTFTTVSKDGYVQGVAIAPGIKTALSSLVSNTAQLPEIPLELPKSVLGRNTTHAMQAGILWGYVGISKELISKIQEEVGSHYFAVATGGLSFVMNPLKDLFKEIQPALTINGMRFMLEDYYKNIK